MSNTKFPSAKEIVESLADKALEVLGRGQPWVHVAGNLRFDGPFDSNRAITCMASLSKESLDPAAPTFMKYANKTLYYKILPYYYPSPLHQHHKVIAMFLSKKPLTMETVVDVPDTKPSSGD
jgi:hypothetical protein